MPGGAMQTDWRQVLFQAMVVLDLSRDRNGHRSAASDFNGLAAWMREEGKEAHSNGQLAINQLKPTDSPESKPARAFLT